MNRRSFFAAGGAVLAAVVAWRVRAQSVAILTVDGPTVRPDFPPWVYVHRAGLMPCGGIAFRLWRKPNPGDPLSHLDCTHVDGTPMHPGERIACGACGRWLGDHPRIVDIERSHAG